MSLNDSLFGEESIRWKEYEEILKMREDKKRATQDENEYNKNIPEPEEEKMTLHPSSLYSPSDWAELFTLCTQVEDLDDPQSPHYIASADRVWEWLCEYSKTHDLPQPEETEKWSDTKYVIKEALMFLDKFAENHTDDFENRK